jgi:hypothetical protein
MPSPARIRQADLARAVPAPRQTTAERAAAIVMALEAAGKPVRAVRLDGRKIEVLLLADSTESQTEEDRCDAAFGVKR